MVYAVREREVRLDPGVVGGQKGSTMDVWREGISGSSTTVRRQQFFGDQSSLWSNSHIHMEKP